MSPVRPAFAKFVFPHPPDPRSQSALPTPGKGEFFSFLMQGASPLATLHCAGRDTVYRVGFRCRKPPGTQYRSRREFGDMATARKVKAARVQSRGCKGR